MFLSYRCRRNLLFILLVSFGVQTYWSNYTTIEGHASRFLSTVEWDFPTSASLGLSVASDAFRDSTSLTFFASTLINESRAESNEKERGPAIATLIPDYWEDYIKVKGAIQSLDMHLSDGQKTPLLLFHEGNIPDEKKSWIRNMTKRQVLFPYIDFTSFPFLRRTAARDRIFPLKMKGRPKQWGYWQMCRFWITRIWEHPILDNYTTIMRIDTDSCFLSPTKGQPTPSLPSGPYVYAPHLTNHPAFSVQDLLNTTLEWIEQTNHTPANKAMWDSIFEFQKKSKNKNVLPCFYNNFEISSVDFFRQPEVRAFQRRITEEEPHGVFRHKWGDAPVRFLTLALYAKPSQLAWGLNASYGHGGQCSQFWEYPVQEKKVVEARIEGSGMFWRNSSINWLHWKGLEGKQVCPEGQVIIDVNTVKSLPRNPRFNCPFERTLPPTYYCGNIARPSHHPYRWECRLKKRLFERLDQFELRNKAFTMLDLGSAYSDWVLALGSYAPRSQLISVEANVAPFRNAFKHIAVNKGLEERVSPLLAAVMSKGRFSGFDRPLVSNNTWHGPFLCDDGSDQLGVMDTLTTSFNSCSSGESKVPIVTIDMILSAMRRQGSLFFVKIDLEGAEYEALKGADETLSDPSKRPCIIMIELKDRDDKPYKQAYDLLLTKGYVDYEDIDSGIQGTDSWPPRGALFSKEGNFEFRLPAKELEQCVARVIKQQQQFT